MTVTPLGIAQSLTMLDAQQVSWGHAAARRLAAIEIDARIRTADAHSDGWYLGENFAFRPSEKRRAPTGAAAEALVKVLGDHEDILASVEAASGYAAEFDDFGPLPSEAPALTLTRHGEALGDLIVRVPIEDAAAPAREGIVVLKAVAARLSLSDAEALSPGDLVILTQGPWPLAASPLGEGSTELAFNPGSGRLSPAFPNSEPSEDIQSVSNPSAMQALTIPVPIRLADVALTPSELASIRAGGTVDLGPVAEGLTVSLSVGGRSIGGGELVRLGDRFGVLLEEATEPADPASGQEPVPEQASGTITLEAG